MFEFFFSLSAKCSNQTDNITGETYRDSREKHFLRATRFVFSSTRAKTAFVYRRESSSSRGQSEPRRSHIPAEKRNYNNNNNPSSPVNERSRGNVFRIDRDWSKKKKKQNRLNAHGAETARGAFRQRATGPSYRRGSRAPTRVVVLKLGISVPPRTHHHSLVIQQQTV